MLDPEAGIRASGYISSRIAWAVLAVLAALLAGLVYRPHSAARTIGSRLRRSALTTSKPADAITAAAPAPRSRAPFLGLVAAEFRLIGRGRVFAVLAFAAAAAGVLGNVRHIGSPAALLLLVFGLSAQAGRSEARQLLSLTSTAPFTPLVRRGAFVLAGTGWSVIMAVPAALTSLSFMPLLLAIATGGVASIVATLLAMVSRSAFAPLIVLLVLWYGYFST